MKKILPLLLIAIVALTSVMASAQQKPAPRTRSSFTVRPRAAATGTFTSIDFAWTYAYTVPPTCPTNGTLADCVIGFTLTDTTLNSVLAGPTALPIGTLAWKWTPAGGLYFGTHCFALVTNGYDDNGNPMVSTAATTCATNSLTTLNPPTGFTATPGP